PRSAHRTLPRAGAVRAAAATGACSRCRGSAGPGAWRAHRGGGATAARTWADWAGRRRRLQVWWDLSADRWRARRPPHDELQILRAAHREQVFAHLVETAPRVEALRAGVAGPDADPQRARPIAQQPAHHRVHDPPAVATGLVAARSEEHTSELQS